MSIIDKVRRYSTILYIYHLIEYKRAILIKHIFSLVSIKMYIIQKVVI